jgi:hypothetical protein
MSYQFIIGMDISKHSFDVAIFSSPLLVSKQRNGSANVPTKLRKQISPLLVTQIPVQPNTVTVQPRCKKYSAVNSLP